MEETDVQNMELLQKRISEIGIIPVIKIKDAAGACALTRPPSGSARTASPILSIWRTSCSALPSISSVTIERKEL